MSESDSTIESNGNGEEPPPEIGREPAIRIEFNVQHEADFINVAELDAGIRMVIGDFAIDRGNISVGIVDDAKMHELNRQFLNHDYTTDVLSFVYDEDEHSISGELILCADYAQRSAAEIPWHPAYELLLYAIHGTLHLMGLDDTDDSGRQEMRSAEREALQRFEIPGAEKHGEPEESGADDSC